MGVVYGKLPNTACSGIHFPKMVHELALNSIMLEKYEIEVPSKKKKKIAILCSRDEASRYTVHHILQGKLVDIEGSAEEKAEEIRGHK